MARPGISSARSTAYRSTVRRISSLPFWLILASSVIASTTQIPAKGTAMYEFKCEIKKQKTARGFDLTGVVWSATAGAGSYRLFVRKEGPNGRSSMVQEGLFSVVSEERRLLGTVSMNAAQGDQIKATLVVSSGDQDVCIVEL